MTLPRFSSSLPKKASHISAGISGCQGGYLEPRSSGIERSHLTYAARRGRPSWIWLVSTTLRYFWKGLLTRSWRLASSSHWRMLGVSGNISGRSGAEKAAKKSFTRAGVSSKVNGSSLRGESEVVIVRFRLFLRVLFRWRYEQGCCLTILSNCMLVPGSSVN